MQRTAHRRRAARFGVFNLSTLLAIEDLAFQKRVSLGIPLSLCTYKGRRSRPE
jgi:hypothetical protein